MTGTQRQRQLAQLLRRAPDLITVDDASEAFDIGRHEAAKLLARWNKQGVLRRIARGLYAPISPIALDREQVLDDPWILVPSLFDPGYIGGWSAAEHWSLTEQIFRSVCVITSNRVRHREQIIQGVKFSIKHLPASAIFGTKSVWRGHIRLQVSDPHKTILDMIVDPALGGGIQHVSDCLQEYVREYQGDMSNLLEYADKLGNGTVFKRLGYLSERAGLSEQFRNECRPRLTKGFAALDPMLSRDRLVTRWRLWIPDFLNENRST